MAHGTEVPEESYFAAGLTVMGSLCGSESTLDLGFDVEPRLYTVCKRAGPPGLLFHGVKGTAVRNMVPAGIPEKIGHPTRSVFNRYKIVSDRDPSDAAAKMGRHLTVLDTSGMPRISRKQKPSVKY